MNRDTNNDDGGWEDIVRRLGGSEYEANAEPFFQEPPVGEFDQPAQTDQPLRYFGPRDYTPAEEDPEDFQPPEPQPVTTANPRSLLSWTGVIVATLVWLCAGLSGWALPWWLLSASILSFLASATSLFFLLPKTWAHRNPSDDGDYGDGAKL